MSWTPPPTEARPMLLRSFILVCTYNLSFNIAGPILPLYMASKGASPWLVGILLSATGILPLLFGIHVGALVDRYGITRVARTSSVLYLASALPLLTLPDPWIATLLFGLIHLAQQGLTVGTQASVAEWSTPATRAGAYGQYGFWVAAGNIAGPLIGGVLADHFGFIAAFGGMSATAAAAIAMTLHLCDPPRPRDGAITLSTAHSAALRVMRIHGLTTVLGIAFVAIGTQSLLQTYYPLFLEERGFTKSSIGTLFAIAHVASMVIRPLVGVFVDRFGSVRILMAATIIGSLGFGVIPCLDGLAAQAFASCLMGISTGFTQPITMTLIAGAVPPDMLGVALAVRLVAQRLSQVVGPIAFSAAVARYGLGAVFYGAAIILSLATAVIGRASPKLSQVGRPDATRPASSPAELEGARKTW
ncbi:MAG: MFS transporter [Armatimonadetes bacterium]|nr:MFS transporter [Armatimonadota bacterium]